MTSSTSPLGKDGDNKIQSNVRPNLCILFGSETGTAQDVAERIAREAKRRRMGAITMAMDDFDITTLLDQTMIIFIASTTGQGTAPRNMTQFWRFLLRSDLPQDLLSDLECAVFGLGDSSYRQFCWPAKKLARRLELLGAKFLVERGEGDDQSYLGIEPALRSWMDSLFQVLDARFPLPPGLELLPEFQRPPPQLRLTPLEDQPVSFPLQDANVTQQETSKPLANGMQWATLSKVERVTSEDHFQDVRHFELSFEEDLDFYPGDVIDILPENPSEDVEQFIKFMNWDNVADQPIELSETSSEHSFPKNWPKRTTLRHLLTTQLDIFSVPRRSFFEWLSHFTTKESETEKLREFLTPEGQEDLWDYANRPRRTIFEVLTEFRSARIPLNYIADIFPQIRPRSFSIASSARMHRRQAHLLIAVVKYKTNLKVPRRGVCTTWLSRLRVGDRIPVTFSPGTMQLPQDPSTPIMLVGPGTGIAAFRAFTQERVLQGSKENLVFFGCRSASKDLYYEQEWKALQQQGNLVFDVAASRDQENKVYVQHRIKEKGALVWEYIHGKEGTIYICGSSGNMPKAVRKSLTGIFVEHGKMSEEEANEYLEMLDRNRRIQEETWS